MKNIEGTVPGLAPSSTAEAMQPSLSILSGWDRPLCVDRSACGEDSDALQEAVQHATGGLAQDAGRGDTRHGLFAHLEPLLQDHEDHCSDEEVERVDGRQDEPDADAGRGGNELPNLLHPLHNGGNDSSQTEDEHQIEGVVGELAVGEQDCEPRPRLGHRCRQSIVVERDIDEPAHEVVNHHTNDSDHRQHQGLQSHLELGVHPELAPGVEILTQDAGLSGSASDHTRTREAHQLVHPAGQGTHALKYDTHGAHRVEGCLPGRARGDEVEKHRSTHHEDDTDVDTHSEPSPEDENDECSNNKPETCQPLEGNDSSSSTILSALADVLQGPDGAHDGTPVQDHGSQPRGDEEGHTRPEEPVRSGRHAGVGRDDGEQTSPHEETEADSHTENARRTQEERTPCKPYSHQPNGEEGRICRHPLLALEHQDTEEDGREDQDDLGMTGVLGIHRIPDDIRARLPDCPR